MAGNTFGKFFSVTSFGESHGPAIGCVVDGCPPGLSICVEDIQKELDRRRPGTSRHVTQRREPDTVEILSGVFDGRTTGVPIALLIRNVDQRSKDYGNIADQFRPGHADYTYWQKYGERDFRGGGRSSARETAARVAAGAIAKKWLRERYGVEVRGCMSQIGPVKIDFKTWDSVYQNPFFSPDPTIVPELEQPMDQLRKSGDSCGAKITVFRLCKADGILMDGARGNPAFLVFFGTIPNMFSSYCRRASGMLCFNTFLLIRARSSDAGWGY